MEETFGRVNQTNHEKYLHNQKNKRRIRYERRRRKTTASSLHSESNIINLLQTRHVLKFVFVIY